ncbi:Ada metal-binding domain-containing protein [Secundilactobacillus paracollinoides]|uniref:Ada metal-binding domain-containing protein n=1 Tax=Secundilactobacillus paracollinoides TaxID=240427 RepID=UPI0006D01A63|nr:Ada metal-binding domain-containing protein [Secundilactobacillus paracollinoides]KRL79141.1 putative ada regulatory protein [Secundilactobacillus paracollinoides DSM 15502 = JCM 11969]
MTEHRLTARRWQAIQQNDHQFDDQFWYGVTTTKIFCRPSCDSRLPIQTHIRIFLSPQEAIAAGFRPCKRCAPTGQPVTNQTWVTEIDQILTAHFKDSLSMTTLAALAHGSESYIRHTYKRVTGQTPQQKLIDLRLTEAATLLTTTTQSISWIAAESGIPNTAYFTTAFKTKFHVSPSHYRKEAQHANR